MDVPDGGLDMFGRGLLALLQFRHVDLRHRRATALGHLQTQQLIRGVLVRQAMLGEVLTEALDLCEGEWRGK